MSHAARDPVAAARAAASSVSGAGRPTWVVIPARNEEDGIGPCLAALRAAAEHAPGSVHVVVVDDGSTDRTASRAYAAMAEWPGDGDHAVMAGRAEGVGWARRVGFEHAMAAAAVGPARVRRGVLPASTPPAAALIATTDADSQVDEYWLAVLHARLDAGDVAIAGDVHLAPGTDERLVAARAARLVRRLAALPTPEAAHLHPHFAGANLGFAIETLCALGPLPTPVSLEDDALLQRCRALGIPVVRDAAAVVVTSARTDGRAEQGLAAALRADLLAVG